MRNMMRYNMKDRMRQWGIKFCEMKLHELLFNIFGIMLVCVIRHILMIHVLDLPANIYTGVSWVTFKFLIIDIFKEFLEGKGYNFKVGQLLWGKNYMVNANPGGVVGTQNGLNTNGGQSTQSSSNQQSPNLTQPPTIIDQGYPE